MVLGVWGCTAAAFGVQVVAGAVAVALQTEKFFDLVGSLTYALLVYLTYPGVGAASVQATLVSGAVLLCRVYLSGFLFYRVLHHNGDRRFAKVKKNPKRFFFFWIMQGLWTIVTFLPVIFVNTATTSTSDAQLQPIDMLGLVVFAVGLVIEVVADVQKFSFRSHAANADKFITTGLWSISRHPNYFGEILVWVGIYIASFSVLSGWQHVAVASPLFTVWLLTSVSGIPILERMANKRWGALPEYVAYRDSTAVLIPFVW
ncbi:hypothetical protein PTSG_12778 [Salpingoeca rosetta]|uniref:Uncharacterized protein n=1 Tax=Salpingoeca rosetta (strain ATCC 50818 / BSB-021) TaxID=946362 RepID=F2UKG5_SALR5|nr:uncharacterized protein PTSG_12778 [Salpingoeca rosetta]EGD77614.1 hypothetical protein PTSG_12778 [Salpingoeca rosetta]|eukprot:XP_004990502.1 hypothetical protein PTSG_12778 [Salpingoeca rosetta]